jgi:hypothetical protein
MIISIKSNWEFKMELIVMMKEGRKDRDSVSI